MRPYQSQNLLILARAKRPEECEFYLEAIDHDVRKPHERPSIGVLLCATKDNEVFYKYAVSTRLRRNGQWIAATRFRMHRL